MKKNLLFSWLLVCMAALSMVACSNDDSPTPKGISLKDSYTVTRSSVLNIQPQAHDYEGATYRWYLTQTPNSPADSLLQETAELAFIAITPGTYALNLEVSHNGSTEEFNTEVIVQQEAKAFSPYIAKVLEYLPGVGQFVNIMPEYEAGDTPASMLAKTNALLVGEAASMVNLGGFGGYVTFRFDHTVANMPGVCDFRIKGNAFGAASNPEPNAPFGGSCEPGVIMVAYDANQNGVADEDEWYEIGGSAHQSVRDEPWYALGLKAGNDMKVIRDYEITYFRPQQETDQPAENYIRWEDNLGNSGYRAKNMFHTQPYFPAWIEGDSYTLRGTRLPQNGIDESGQGNYFVLYAMGYGYADNYPNTDDKSAIDIAWATDDQGNKVHLPGIDFVRVYSAVNQENGWLGEASTEVAGAEDLHLLGQTIETIN
ncbi:MULTISPECIES: hypothetical protein [unclassified Carboxylicivirga]|uniref:hypothetical protein n=1 Tax=Carboxylicivirga TaxID=1628153 RepID=UPI003D3426E7